MLRARRTFVSAVLALTLAMAPLATAKEAASERVQVGESAPDFTLPDPEGADHALSMLRGEKNVLLVFFRGAW